MKRTCLAVSCGLAVAACAAEPTETSHAIAQQEAALGNGPLSENPAAKSPDWPSAGHDWHHTGHNPRESAISPANVGDLQVVWALENVGEPEPSVIGTPVVAGDVVYFTDQYGNVHAREHADGAVVWTQAISDAAGDPLYGSRFQAGSVVTPQALYVADADAVLYKLDRDTGAVLWSTLLDEEPGSLVQGDLATFGPYIVTGVAGFENALPDAPEDSFLRGSVVAVHRNTGEIVWKSYTTSDQRLDNPKWGAGVGVWSSPAIDPTRGSLFIGTGQFYEPGSPMPDPESADEPDYSDSILAVDLHSGDIYNSRQFTAGDIWGTRYPEGKDWDVGIPPTLFTIDDASGPIDAVGVGDKKGIYYVMRRDTLEILWEKEVADGSVIGGFQATAAYADGVLYVGAHERIDGESLTADIPPGQSGTFLSTPEGIIFSQVGARTNLMALDAATGAVIWERPSLGALTFAPLLLANGVLYQGDMNGTVHAFDAATGAELFTHRIGGIPVAPGVIALGNIIVSMSIAHGRLFVASAPVLPGSPTGLQVFGLPE